MPAASVQNILKVSQNDKTKASLQLLDIRYLLLSTEIYSESYRI